jgi:hypothetical protein
MQMCGSKLVEDSTPNFIDRVMLNKPSYHQPIINSTIPTYKFLFFTDVHADEKYLEVNNFI